MLREIPLAEFGLETVPGVSGRKGKGWTRKTVLNWINAGLLPAVVVGGGPSSRFLVRTADVEAFTPPRRGPKPKAKQTATRMTARTKGNGKLTRGK